MKLDRDDVAHICPRVGGHDVSPSIVADQFEVSRRRLQRFADQYRDTGDVPPPDTPGRKPCADHPTTSPTASSPSTTAGASAPSPTSGAFATTTASPPTPSTRFPKLTTP